MPQPRLSILMYHQVGDFAPMRAHRASYCDRRRFAAQMALLARLGCNVIGLDAALEGLRGQRPLPGRAVVLTFDDAYANFREHALPVLQRHGFPATLYAISGWLGQPAVWLAKDPGRPIPWLLSGTALRELHQAGITIGSHGVTHAKLGELDPAAKRRELIDSKAALEDLLGAPVQHFCYPYGSFDLDSVQAAAAAGYVSATTCLRGAATPGDHPLALPRKAISFGDDLLGFWWKLVVKQTPKPALRAWRARLAEH